MYVNAESRNIRAQCSELAEIINELINILLNAEKFGLSFDDEQDTLKTFYRVTKAYSEAFKIVVVGEFKNGKSTFINAILGKKIMPEDILPCTGTITEIKYGSQEKAEIHFLDPLPEKISPFIPDKIKPHINKYRPGKIPPLNLTVKEYQECVRIPEDEADSQAKSLELMPYSRAVVYLPLEILKNDTNIIDTPGLNEDPRREAITINYIEQADIIIFVFRCPKYQGITDEIYINNIIRPITKEIFFVCTHFDEIPGEHKEYLEYRAVNYLKNFTDFGEGGVFLVSSTEGHNINRFKRAISNYLRDKNVTLQDLMRIREKIFSCISSIKTITKIYLSDLNIRLDNYSYFSRITESNLHSAEIKKAEILELLDTAIERYDLFNKIMIIQALTQDKYSKLEIRNIINSFINDLCMDLDVNIREFYALSRNTSSTKIDLCINFPYMFDGIRDIDSDIKIDTTFGTYAEDIYRKYKSLAYDH
ncbi:MAG: dynamin family protein [Synergistaceae bacterium]|nr:dynamin family protein [Synergistaceae bacterium]